MGLVTLPSFGTDPATVTAAGLDGKVDPLATEFNGGIDNSNIASDAAIGNAKLNLAAISQDITHSGAMVHSGLLTMSGKDFTEAKCADIASATTTTIWATDGNYAHITGTTTITSFGTAQQAGDRRIIVFDGILTLTHNATSLILPGGSNITTAAGDCAIVIAESTSNARVVLYSRKDGTAVVSTTVPSAASQAEMEAATSTSVYATPGRTQYHPGVAKAWGKFNGTSTPAFAVRHNFDASITDNGVGDYSIAITTDMSGNDFAVIGTGSQDAGTEYAVSIQAQLAGSIRVITSDLDGVAADAGTIYIAAFGDQ